MNCGLLNLPRTFLFVCSIWCLQACWGPAQYRVVTTGAAGAAQIRQEDWLLTVELAHPALDGSTKVVSVNGRLVNTSRNRRALFRHSTASLTTRNEVFSLNFDNARLEKPFLTEADSLWLAPGEERHVAFHFLGRRMYTDASFAASLSRDSLIFRVDTLLPAVLLVMP